ncbi:hypothetical protein R1sor_005454 [Riccia sorocarpa]|uniref:Wax synthase domain-containing protein n=1 Tax=Riccia sorocarpa TaxID=122646 RepID=A0ABD3HJK2_9MARC
MGAFKLIMLAYDYGPGKDPWMMSSFTRFLTGMSFTIHMNPDPVPSIESKEGEEISDNVSTTDGKNGSGLHLRKSRYRDNQTEVAAEEKRKEDLAKMEGGSRDVTPFFCILGVLFTFELPTAIAASFFQVELPAQFNMPFFATSIGDFWGRRWNLLVNNLLKVSVYFPILEAFGGRSGKRPSFQVKALAVLASFTVSGLMHELIFFYMSQKAPTFEYTMFFVLNGVGTILESWLKRKKYYNPSKLVGWLVTFCFVFFYCLMALFPTYG